MKTIKWKLFSNGICMAKFVLTNNQVRCRPFDIMKGNFLPESSLMKNNQQELFHSKIDIHKILSQYEKYQEVFSTTESSEIHSSLGRYTRKQDPSFYAQRETDSAIDILVVEGEPVAFIAPSRDSTSILVREGYEEKTVLKQWFQHEQDRKYFQIEEPKTEYVAMRDHIRLATDIYLPQGKKEKGEAILIRTPYGRKGNVAPYLHYVYRGYALVIQDVRGRHDSEGEFFPMENEIEDGNDTLNWIASQQWSNGKVGMIGGSYLGYVQWAAAASGSPHLKAIVSLVASGTPFEDVPRRGGCFASGVMAWAFAMSSKITDLSLLQREDWSEIMKVRPVYDMPIKALGREIPFLNKWFENRDYNQEWEKGDWVKRNRSHEIPSLILSGWFDDNHVGTEQAIKLTEHYAPAHRQIILGPWKHAGNASYDLHHVYMGSEALRYDLDLLYLKWHDQHLKEYGKISQPEVNYFTLNENKWKKAESWPLNKQVEKILFLEKNNLKERVGKNGSESYWYDPLNPAPQLIDVSENEISIPENYKEIEQRDDFLTFSTAELSDTMIVTGKAMAELYISLNVPETDLILRLHDVDSAGNSIRLTDGILCTRYREGKELPTQMTLDQVYLIRVEFNTISNAFQKGHKLRVSITSSAENFLVPHGNTAVGPNEKDPQKAKIMLHYGPSYPSKIILPTEPATTKNI